MKRMLLAAVLSIAATAAAGQQADPVKLTIPRAMLATIGQGVMEMPYKTAAPILNELQAQLNAADAEAAKAAKEAAKAAEAEKPAKE